MTLSADPVAREEMEQKMDALELESTTITAVT